MRAPTESPRTVRLLGGLLAFVWLGAGLGAMVLGVGRSRGLLVGLGLVAFGYGLLWARVVRMGRRLTPREAWPPWHWKPSPDT